jgi:poly(3-hydroxybutyrate) depolymerase
MARYTGLSEDADDFLVAYPTTPHDNGFWRPDDVPALLALVDAIDRCTPVATVMAVGFSNGGLMANALACRAADRVRAIVTVASGYLGLGRCAPWARRDGCGPAPTARRAEDGWPITQLRWHGCAGGVHMQHLRVSGDTHGWPSPEDANERILTFLRGAV